MTAEGGGKSAGVELSDFTGFGTRDRTAEKTSLSANGIPEVITARWESALRITADDKKILFTALVGRLSLSQNFFPPEMLIKGTLEL